MITPLISSAGGVLQVKVAERGEVVVPVNPSGGALGAIESTISQSSPEERYVYIPVCKVVVETEAVATETGP